MVSLGFDAAGNLTGDGRFSHRYNAAGRRIASTDTTTGQTVSYGYDALGQRIGKTANGLTTQFFYDEQGHLTGEYDSTGQWLQEIVWLGDLPVAVLKPATGSTAAIEVYYIHADHLGTPRKITRPSDNKAVWTWESEAFGNSLPEQNPAGLGNFVFNLRFPGQHYDQETGLFYNVFRDYEPATGRYIQSDPIGLAGGINTYAYVENNPVNWIDPLGNSKVQGQASIGGNDPAIAGVNKTSTPEQIKQAIQRAEDVLNDPAASPARKRILKGWIKVAKRGFTKSICPSFIEDVVKSQVQQDCMNGNVTSCRIFLEMGGQFDNGEI